MLAIRLVAAAVFRESVRDRVPYSIVAFAVLLIGASYLISQLTAGQDMKIIKDLGLAAISWFGMLIAVFIGIGLVSKEVERRSVFGVLAKPLTRTQFVLGKYAGLVLTLAVNLSVMTAAFFVVLAYMEATANEAVRASWSAPALDARLLVAILLIVGELALVTALAVFFSTFSSPLLSALLTLGLWGAGHFSADLHDIGTVVDAPVVALLAKMAYYVVPNLGPFNVRAEAVHGVSVAASQVVLTLLYAAVYITLLLTGAVAIFRRRDFK